MGNGAQINIADIVIDVDDVKFRFEKSDASYKEVRNFLQDMAAHFDRKHDVALQAEKRAVFNPIKTG